MTILLLILGLVLFIGLIVLHEFGHFMTARRNGVEVEEFGIGFPPKLWAKRMPGGYDFSLNLLPLGGFVKLKGEHDADRNKGSFGAASLWAKTKIMLAGVTINLVAALVIFTLVALIGMPKIITPDNLGVDQYTVRSDTKTIRNDVLIGDIESRSPAAKAGLKTGDQLLSVATISVSNSSGLPAITKARPGQPVAISYERNHQIYQTRAVLRSKQEVDSSPGGANHKGYLGVVPVDYTIQRSTWSAPVVAVGLSAQLTQLTMKGLWSAVRGLGSLVAGLVTGNKVARQAGQVQATQQVSGPVGIFFILKQGASHGLNFVLFIVGVISLTLAIMNVLPIPALDGGRFYLLFISRKLFRKPLNQKLEERIVGSSFAALMLLFILITFVDIRRFH